MLRADRTMELAGRTTRLKIGRVEVLDIRPLHRGLATGIRVRFEFPTERNERIIGYRHKVGTSPWEGDVRDWRETAESEPMLSGLSVFPDQPYYVTA